MDPNTSEQLPTPIVCHEGGTPSERYLSKLCRQSFLSLWSYPSVFRNQGDGVAKGGDGKEVCDLLVVFGDDVLIFSDKDCAFPSSGCLDTDWARWFKRAVAKSADQVFGAERWVRDFPDRLYLDRKCTRKFPVSLPPRERMRVHRIVVAHDASRRCRELLGGTGSLIIIPSLTGKKHFEGPVTIDDESKLLSRICAASLKEQAGYLGRVLPFMIGDIDPVREFVHVLDDIGLETVLRTLDTTADFVTYLDKRAKYIRSGTLLMASGEDDLLAHYLQQVDDDGLCDFFRPDDPETRIIIPEGEWRLLQLDPKWTARQTANRVSYLWDEMIERFNQGILDGTSPAYPVADFSRQEYGVRALARESRISRRFLATMLSNFLGQGLSDHINTRIVQPLRSGLPYYIFLTVRPNMTQSRDDYRQLRWGVMYHYCVAVKQHYTNANEIIVIATEPRNWDKWASEDVFYRPDVPMSDDERRDATLAKDELKFLTKLGTPVAYRSYEYPQEAADQRHTGAKRNKRSAPSVRNSPCPCGSGLKAKRCCMNRS